MRLRIDFVTNSSSSSFIIRKKYLSQYQIEKIYEHVKYCEDSYDIWRIKEDKKYITGSTDMDNFDMEEYLKQIGVNENFINWSEYSFDLEDYEE